MTSAPSARPSFGLSSWRSPHEPDAWAEWQAHVDAGRIGVRLRDPVLEAAADEMARIVRGRGRGAFRRDVASGSSTSGGVEGG